MLNPANAALDFDKALEHASCSVRDTFGQPIHSHSHSHSFKTLNPETRPSQAEKISGSLTLRPYQAAAVQNLRLGLGKGVRRSLPPVELLREWFAYDAQCGRLVWLKRSGNKATAGVVAGYAQRNGYRYVEFQGKSYREHRLVWAICTGEESVGDLDHINGIRDDNRIENLRDIGRHGNAQNERTARKSNRSTGLLGVYRVGRKFRAIITAHGERIDLGRFTSAEEASEAYLKAKRELHEGCTI